jgi:Rod binding domain-containing protein
MDPLTAAPLAGQAVAGIDPAALKNGTTSGKLHKAAIDFEALMIGEMLKSTREEGSDGWLGSGDSTGNDSAMELAEGQLAHALAQGGGIGLAGLIESRLRPAAQHISASSGTPSPGSLK